MKKRLISIFSVGVMSALIGTFVQFSASAVMDNNGNIRSYYNAVSDTYTCYSFGSGTGWKSKKVGNLVRANSYTGNSFDAGYVTAYYNYDLFSNDKAYTAVTSSLYNCYYDCLVNSSGSTQYSSTMYGSSVSSPQISVTTGNGVKYRGTTYWN